MTRPLHRLRMVPLTVGLAYLALGAAAYAEAAGGDREAWLAPLLLAVAGAAVVAGALWTWQRRS